MEIYTNRESIPRECMYCVSSIYERCTGYFVNGKIICSHCLLEQASQELRDNWYD